MMKTLLAVEEWFFLLLSIFLFAQLPYAWWWFPVLLFVPDLSMIGYLRNPALGAAVYNFFHHRAVAVTAFIAGALLGSPLLQLAGVMLLAHSSLDRAVGYGLKYPDSFKHTNLGWIGRAGDAD
jgi:hypothetical protein